MHILDAKHKINNGFWEGRLGNIDRQSVEIYTDKNMTGTQLKNYYMYGPLNDTTLRVYGPDGDIYISFEQLDVYEGTAVPTGALLTDDNLKRILDRMNEIERTAGDLKDMSAAFTTAGESWKE